MAQFDVVAVADFVIQISGFDGDLRVLGFSGTEGISELFTFSLSLASDDGEIDIDALVGQPAAITIFHENGERYIHGIISRFEQGSEGTDFTPYYAEMVPEVWLLTQRFGCRIHQEMDVGEIIEKELTDAGIPTDKFELNLTADYEKREFCVRYRESIWNFLARLMEDEGIFYYFEHTEEGAVLKIADAESAHESIASPDIIPFRDMSGLVEGEEAVFTYRYSQELRPGTVTYRDFDFEKPSLLFEGQMEKTTSAERDDSLEVYDYPGGYVKPDVGETIADLRKQALQSRRIIGLGESLVRRFIPGFKFTLEEHPRSDFNREYIITWISHRGTQPHGEASAGGHFEYNNEFRCIPSDTPYRPARRTPRPVVEGTQTAIVTGPSGEEIWPDKHGRVKVQFHWDREGNYDENSSCWIRVSQLWAGLSWGAMWIPRIGHEVIVDFLEGNPDKPIIIGRVYHGENPPPYKLPDDKTKSTIKSESSKGGGGFNEIRFEDLKGSEEVFIQAEKDMNETIKNNRSSTIGNDRSESVGNNRTRTVKNDETVSINNNQTITVKKNITITSTEGNYSASTVKGTTTVSSKGDTSHSTNANYSITADSDITAKGANIYLTGEGEMNSKGATVGIEASGAMVAKGKPVTIESGSNLTNKGATVDVKGSGAVNVDGTPVKIISGGSTIEVSPAGIKMSSGSGSVVIDAAGVTITGAIVKIN